MISYGPSVSRCCFSCFSFSVLFFYQNLALPKIAQCSVGPQVMKTRLEADEVAAQLERCDKENKILKDEMNKEIEAVLLPVLAFFPSPVPGLQSVPPLCP